MKERERSKITADVFLEPEMDANCDAPSLNAVVVADTSEMGALSEVGPAEASQTSGDLTGDDEQSPKLGGNGRLPSRKQRAVLVALLLIPLIAFTLLPHIGYLTGNTEAAIIIASHRINPPKDKFALWYRLYNTGMCNFGERGFEQRKALLLQSIEEASRFGERNDRLVESHRAYGEVLTNIADNLTSANEKQSYVLEARQHLEKALSLAISLHGPRHRCLCEVYRGIAGSFFVEARLYETHRKINQEIPRSHFNCRECEIHSQKRAETIRRGQHFQLLRLKTALVSTGKLSNETMAASPLEPSWWTDYKWVCMPNSEFHRRMFQYEFPGNHDDNCIGCEYCEIYPDLVNDTGTKLRVQAEIEECNGNFEAAESLYIKAIADQKQKFGSRHPMLAIALNSYACFLRGRGKIDKAIPLEAQCDAIWKIPTPGWIVPVTDADKVRDGQ